MNKLTHTLTAIATFAALTLTTSCSMMTEDREGCDEGIYVAFKYNYNLQRANMFHDHVGSVTLFVFDENNQLVRTQTESNTAGSKPLAQEGYLMHVSGLPEGRYRLLALAGQDDYESQMARPRAHFVRSDMNYGSSIESVGVTLDHSKSATGVHYDVLNNDMPLDTLWHAIGDNFVTVESNSATIDTMSLVRDTKHITVTLRDIDSPETVDIADYELYIDDHNAHINYDNSVDENEQLRYTPYAEWNSDDKTDETPTVTRADGDGRIAHANFMTSRIIYHDLISDDGRLVVKRRDSGVTLINVNLPDMLSRLRTADYLHTYSPQEFLDRGYDYQLHFYLRGDKIIGVYIAVSVETLSWSKRVQIEDLK